jgi:hypothetical protein
MRVPEKLEELIRRIMEENYSDDEWLALQKEVDQYFRILPEELQDYFVDSGAGEVLDTICDGIPYDRALRSYGVVIDEETGAFLSWGQLEPGEMLEYDPKTQSYKRSCELNKQ